VVAKDRDLLRMLTEATVRGHPPGITNHTNPFPYPSNLSFSIRLASQQHPSTSLCGSDREIFITPESLFPNLDPE
jgi:hypothetical protein